MDHNAGEERRGDRIEEEQLTDQDVVLTDSWQECEKF